MQKHRFAPSPAIVVSMIALFVALGGTSYAAITSLPANSVGTRQLKNGAVTATKISSSARGAVKVVGGAGAPAYAGSWGTPGSSDEGVSFYKDAFGIVHLQGNASNSLGSVADTIFTLPAGYRPAGDLYFAVYGYSSTAAYIQIMNDGEVVEFNVPQAYVGLSNITFRAGL